MNPLQRAVRRGFAPLEACFDRIFGAAGNPLHQLGALGFLYFWVVLVSGIYLYAFFDTGTAAAYRSVEAITHAQWYAGGVMRSLHRYASDALVAMLLLHALREWSLDRLRGARWFTWVTGVPVMWLVYVSGISGYWLVWDRLAQYVAIASAEWLDALPLFGGSIARNFLSVGSLDDRFFSLLIFMHIAVPLILLFVLWIHLQRVTRPRLNPPRALAGATLVMLVALSLAWPATSQGPADLARVPAAVGLDWFYLALYPLIDRFGGIAGWVVVGVGSLLLLILPWLPPRRVAVARVDLANCNGCTRCAQDCPYAAIRMAPRSDGAAFEREAVVDAAHCVACGICAGACPTATPFRRMSDLSPGIDLPAASVRDLRARTDAALAGAGARPRVLIYACDHGAAPAGVGAAAAVVTVPCVGAVPPSFIDYALSRAGADGVLLSGCRDGECYNRFGMQWTEERIEGRRDPKLRARVPRARVRMVGLAPGDGRGLAAALADFTEAVARDRAVTVAPTGTAMAVDDD